MAKSPHLEIGGTNIQKMANCPLEKSGDERVSLSTARCVEDETRNAELNGNRNPECWGDFSQPVKIEKIKFFGTSRYKVELRF